MLVYLQALLVGWRKMENRESAGRFKLQEPPTHFCLLQHHRELYEFMTSYIT